MILRKRTVIHAAREKFSCREGEKIAQVPLIGASDAIAGVGCRLSDPLSAREVARTRFPGPAISAESSPVILILRSRDVPLFAGSMRMSRLSPGTSHPLPPGPVESDRLLLSRPALDAGKRFQSGLNRLSAFWRIDVQSGRNYGSVSVRLDAVEGQNFHPECRFATTLTGSRLV